MTDDAVDLRSDTLTRPTDAMRTAMADAEVGDDVFGEDPTVNALEARCAELTGKERGLFVPSGTMANLLAFLSQTQPGDTALLHETAHPFRYESGNLAAVGGILTRILPGALGMVSPEGVAPYIASKPDHHVSPVTILSVENTTNAGGGNLYALETLAALRKMASANDVKLHMDGARLFNAVIASGHSAKEFAQYSDTVCFCFSKGLGAPVGSIVVGTEATIDGAHRFRKMLGGGMRQAGVLAAAANYALDHHVDRLAEDHRRAAAFRQALEDLPGVAFPMPNPTNIVFFDVDDAPALVNGLADAGVRVLAMDDTRIRAVFHLDVDDRGLDRAVEACRRVLGN
jgi:threonine aldolase